MISLQLMLCIIYLIFKARNIKFILINFSNLYSNEKAKILKSSF
jgi:hypothetical protein